MNFKSEGFIKLCPNCASSLSKFCYKLKKVCADIPNFKLFC